MRDDIELLRRYALGRDNKAFAELVGGSIDFVYAAALRQCRGNARLAQDVTQLVFTDLSRRARTLTDHPALAGWLHTATRFAAMKILRAEARRKAREQAAASDRSLVGDQTPSIDWSQLQPVLDEAIGELKERDRMAILMRFFQGKSLREVGERLQLSETAARSCLDRALDRLRGRLARHGITSTAAALSVALAQQVVTAAPAGLASAVSGVALAQSPVGAAALIPLIAMKKIIAVAVALVLAGELAVATVELKTKRSLEAEHQQLIAETAAAPRTAPAQMVVATNTDSAAPELSADERSEIGRLENRLAQLRARPAGVVDTQMKIPRAVGRETPQAAIETLTAALRDHDMATLERFVVFSDNTPENRTAFMTRFSEGVRARYSTPEAVMIAFSFDEVLRDAPVAQQILFAHGYSGGVQTVTAWTRLSSGRERQDTIPFEKTADGWTLSTLQLAGKNKNAVSIDALVARFDPITGNVLPARR